MTVPELVETCRTEPQHGHATATTPSSTGATGLGESGRTGAIEETCSLGSSGRLGGFEAARTGVAGRSVICGASSTAGPPYSCLTPEFPIY